MAEERRTLEDHFHLRNLDENIKLTLHMIRKGLDTGRRDATNVTKEIAKFIDSYVLE